MVGAGAGAGESWQGSVRRHPDFLASACVGGKDRAAFEAEYRLGPLLGKGGFGTVFAGHRVTDRLQVCTTSVFGESGVFGRVWGSLTWDAG
jgi:hypothetical protein